MNIFRSNTTHAPLIPFLYEYECINLLCTQSKDARTVHVPVLSLSHSFTNVDPTTTSSITSTVEILQQSVGIQWVGEMWVLDSGDVPYPAIVLTVDDDDIEMQVMHKIGSDRYCNFSR